MNKNMNNKNEKYYTTNDIIEHMYNVLEENNIEAEEWLENSAGGGALIDFLKTKSDKKILAYDIKNETEREDIIECDYKKLKLDYKKGRVAFINPPFTQGLKFVYKALTECDYCVALLSINSILNLDYDNYEVIGNIYFKKNAVFGDIKVNICIMLIKKK
jgi:hypothetical protein